MAWPGDDSGYLRHHLRRRGLCFNRCRAPTACKLRGVGKNRGCIAAHSLEPNPVANVYPAPNLPARRHGDGRAASAALLAASRHNHPDPFSDGNRHGEPNSHHNCHADRNGHRDRHALHHSHAVADRFGNSNPHLHSDRDPASAYRPSSYSPSAHGD